MGAIEFGKCEVCGKETQLERTYFYYPIHCECCGCVDEKGQKMHFELVCHCRDCPAPVPSIIHPVLKDTWMKTHRANISNIMPSCIKGKFVTK